MHRKVKNTKGYLHLSQAKRTAGACGLPEGFQSLDPGESGEWLAQKVAQLARAGALECFLLTDKNLKKKTLQQFPFWVRRLKTDHPQMDFHIRAGRPYER